MFDSLFPSHWSDLQKLMWLKILKGGSAVWDTISGNPVSFSAKAAPLRKLEVAFSPVQSLNGYDAPWPAGGGKNKLAPAEAFTQTINGVTLVCDGNGNYTLSGTATGGSASFTFPITATHELQSGEYLHIRNSAANGNMTMSLMAASDNIRYWGLSPANRVVNIQDTDVGKTVARLNIYVANGATADMTITPSIEADSAVTAFSPYSNECPISGWSSLNVEQRGKNLWNGKFVSAGFTESDTYSSTYKYVGNAYMPIKAGARYVASVDGTRASIRYCFLTAAKTRIGDYTNADETTVAPVNAVYLQWRLQSDYGANAKGQIEVGTTATAYAPYNPSSRSISINLGQTVYSGYVDVVTGVVTVDMAMQDMGNMVWGYAPSYDGFFFSHTIADSASEQTWECKCSQYKNLRMTASGIQANDGCIEINAENGRAITGATGFKGVIVTDRRYTDADTFTTALSGVPLLYKLATPITIQLTQQEVSSLLGDNTMWSDANQPITVEYRSN